MVLGLFVGCTSQQTVDFQLAEKVSFTRIEPEHRGKIKEFTVNDKEYIELNNWLNNNKNGWEKIKTERYPTHLIHSGKYWIGIVDNTVLIFYQEYIDSTYIYQKPIKVDELIFLNKGSFMYKDD